MKKNLLFLTFIFCCFQTSFSQVNLTYNSNYVFDGVTGVGIGNGDGIPQPNETVGVRVELINNGGMDAHNITSVFSTTDTNVVIIDNDIIYPDIITSGYAASYDEFLFEVKDNCASGFVTFTMTTTCFEGTFVEPFLLIIDCSTVSLAEQEKKNKINISANPSDGNISISSPYTINSLQIFNTLGERVQSSNVSESKIDLQLNPALENGIYFIRIHAGEKFYSGKILLQR